MKRHLADCTAAAPTAQLDALRSQAKYAASESDGSSKDASPMAQYVDKVKVTDHQLKTWRNLLAVAVIMTGWSFQTVENPQFVDIYRYMLMEAFDTIRDHSGIKWSRFTPVAEHSALAFSHSAFG